MRRIQASHLRSIVGPVALAIGLAASTPALCGTTFGVRTGVYTDASAGFVGGEVVVDRPSWYFNPNPKWRRRAIVT